MKVIFLGCRGFHFSNSLSLYLFVFFFLKQLWGELGRRGLSGIIKPSVFLSPLQLRLGWHEGLPTFTRPSQGQGRGSRLYFITVRAIFLLGEPFLSVFSQMLAQRG